MDTVPWWEEEPASNDAPVLLSMIEHFSYCPRQCALIHIEQAYDDNVFTLQGKEGHERVDEPISGVTNGIRFERALPLFSHKLNLTGKADLIEFPDGIPYPVEYKHGKSGHGHAEAQLCGQALCLEEMLGISVPKGALYSLKTHQRKEVQFTESLRQRTFELIAEVHRLMKQYSLPPAVNDKRCANCSLIEICQPTLFAQANRSRLITEWKRSLTPEEF